MDVGREDDAAPAEVPQQGAKSLARLKTDFCDAIEFAGEQRRLSFRDEEMYHNFDDDHWTELEKRELKDRRQPIVTSNWIKRRVLFAQGMEQRTRTDPKAWPRNPGQEQAAETATEVLDYIETSKRFDQVASRCFLDFAIMGTEVAEVVVEYGEVCINRIRFSKFFWDPRSRELDFSDARYLGYVDWFDAEEVRELFPDAQNIEEAIAGSYAEGELEKGYEDKPENWGDRTRERVRVVVMYYKTRMNEWRYAYFTGGGVLMDGVSQYQDEDGNPDCPIIAISYEITEDNERYGIVRDMVSLNREVNMRRSLSLSLLKNRRLWAQDESIFPNKEEARREIGRSDAILIARGPFGQAWGFIESQSEIQGNFELLQEAKGELQIQQANAALQGREVSNQSGRAIIAQQQAGMTEDNKLFDLHNDWKRRIYSAMWARAKQFWTEEKFIRVTDDENGFRFVHINKPVVGPMGVDPTTGQPMMGIVNVENALAQMDVDIIVETAPDLITLQHETFQMLTELAQGGIPIPPQALIQMAPNFHDKKRVLQILEEAQQAAAPLQQAQAQMAMEKETAEISKTKAETLNINAKTSKDLMPEPKPQPQQGF